MRTATVFIFVLCVLDAKLVWAGEPPATAGAGVEVGVAAPSAYVERGVTIRHRAAAASEEPGARAEVIVPVVGRSRTLVGASHVSSARQSVAPSEALGEAAPERFAA